MTPRQQQFVDEYLVDLNATKAALRAGFSERSAYSTGQRLLKNAEIQARISEAMQSRQDRTQITSDRVLYELGRIGLSDVRRAFTESGALRSIHDLDDDTAAAVASVEVVTRSLGDGDVEYVHKIRLWPKVPALELLGKHMALWRERVEHTGKDGGPIRTEGGISDETAAMIRAKILGITKDDEPD